ncbi:hypothetical protein pdam_00024634 [Pocillopora damicornis]|uniref:Uncharacterized protein n=1 Tax=Pocillopora damicornis TaxID=46731 RepID=A0A3M6TBX2_POCDA|nr:hypothetical protein pdam_00024634 [Pocillopora damicornis]
MSDHQSSIHQEEPRKLNDAIRISDISKSVQMRLMRQKSGLILQTQSKVEYDKSLKKPSSVILEMK